MSLVQWLLGTERMGDTAALRELRSDGLHPLLDST